MKKYATIYDQLEKDILSKQIEANIVGNALPEIYYYGRAKTGSSSLRFGFPKNSVAHWHILRYFEELYDTDLLSKNNLDLYDLSSYFGKKYSFKPLIIDAIREPVSQTISIILQLAKKNEAFNSGDVEFGDELKNKFIETIRNRLLTTPHILVPYSAQDWKNRFQVDVFEKNHVNNYFYEETNDTKLLFLRFEDVADRPTVFKKLGYEYSEGHHNNTAKHPVVGVASNWIKSNYDKLAFTDNELEWIYDKNPWVSHCYSQDEIDSFKNKYKKMKNACVG